MKTPLENKSSPREIQKRFDKDVDRFSNLENGQQTTLDAPLVMDIIANAAVSSVSHASTLLDIGCGAGNNSLKVLEYINPLDIDLVDLSNPMLARAQARLSVANSGKIRLFQGDFRDINLPAERYDIIIAAAVLHHLRQDDDWHKVFSKIFHLTAPGGSVWISDLVFHENPAVQEIMWQRYEHYLVALRGREYKEEVVSIVDREDSPRSITYQLDLLRDVGFTQVDILHKNAVFAAFGACKPVKPGKHPD